MLGKFSYALMEGRFNVETPFGSPQPQQETPELLYSKGNCHLF